MVWHTAMMSIIGNFIGGHLINSISSPKPSSFQGYSRSCIVLSAEVYHGGNGTEKLTDA